MSKRIDRVGVREKLVYRRDPYWLRLTAGRYVGFRRMTSGRPGTWLARAYTDAGYKYETLGDFADRPDEERYDLAKQAAEKWFSHLDMGGSTEPTSVKAACEAYLEKLKNERGEQAKKDTEGYFRRLVYGDPDRNSTPPILNGLSSFFGFFAALNDLMSSCVVCGFASNLKSSSLSVESR